jgi:uncharacterized protein YchJ
VRSTQYQLGTWEPSQHLETCVQNAMNHEVHPQCNTLRLHHTDQTVTDFRELNQEGYVRSTQYHLGTWEPSQHLETCVQNAMKHKVHPQCNTLRLHHTDQTVTDFRELIAFYSENYRYNVWPKCTVFVRQNG